MQHCIVSDVTLPQAVLHTDHWMQTMLSGCAALDMTVANDVRPCTRHEDQGKSQEQAVQHYLCCGYRLTQAAVSTSEA